MSIKLSRESKVNVHPDKRAPGLGVQNRSVLEQIIFSGVLWIKEPRYSLKDVYLIKLATSILANARGLYVYGSYDINLITW